MVVCTFISDEGKRSFATYTLDVFKENIDAFMENSRLRLDDPNFIGESNVLDSISDGLGNYFP